MCKCFTEKTENKQSCGYFNFDAQNWVTLVDNFYTNYLIASNHG